MGALVAGAALALALGAPGALAQTAQGQADKSRGAGGEAEEGHRDDAQRLVDAGLDAARAGSFDEAAVKFEAALKLYPHPEIAHNLARAHEELGHPILAITYFRQALEMDAGYTFAVDARERIGALDTELRATHGVLKVTSTPAQVLVSVEANGATIARELATPASIYVPAGEATIRATKSGYLDAQQSATLAAGADLAVELLLRPVPKKGFLRVTAGVPAARVYVNGKLVGSAPVAGHPLEVGRYEVKVTAPGYERWVGSVDIQPGVEAGVAAVMTQSALPDADGSGEGGLGTMGIAGATLIGVGAAAAVTGVALHVVAFQKAADARDVPDFDQAVLDANPALQEIDAANDARYRSLSRDARTFEAVAAVSYGTAAGLVGVGIVLLLLPDTDADSEASEATPGPELTGTFVLGRERFSVGAVLTF